MRLNQYIAHSGFCSRREADKYIKAGRVTINDKPIESLAVRIGDDDVVKIDGARISPDKKLYILLNKPKDFITTTDDEKGRKTVLDLVKNIEEFHPEYKGIRVYPVGRLDRNTTGLLLLTNDGKLTQTLTHPKFEVKKIYHVTLDKPLLLKDFEEIRDKGVQLEDGMMKVDDIAFTDSGSRSKIGVEIHSGRNRIVRRLFEHFGYSVKYLDRVFYAGISKKNLPRGKWRLLSKNELEVLRNRGKVKPKNSYYSKRRRK